LAGGKINMKQVPRFEIAVYILEDIGYNKN